MVCINHEVKAESNNSEVQGFILVGCTTENVLCQSVVNIVITPWPVYHCFCPQSLQLTSTCRFMIHDFMISQLFDLIC